MLRTASSKGTHDLRCTNAAKQKTYLASSLLSLLSYIQIHSTYGRRFALDPGDNRYTYAAPAAPGCRYTLPSAVKVWTSPTIKTLFRLMNL